MICPGRHELDEIVVALERLSQQDEVILRLTRIAALRVAAARRHVHFAPEDGIQSARSRMIVKDDRREHVPVLGHRNRRHLQLHRLIEQFVDSARAVEQRKLGVQMEMDEFRHHLIISRGGPTPGRLMSHRADAALR